jgi:hypothetical protein
MKSYCGTPPRVFGPYMFGPKTQVNTHPWIPVLENLTSEFGLGLLHLLC